MFRDFAGSRFRDVLGLDWDKRFRGNFGALGRRRQVATLGARRSRRLAGNAAAPQRPARRRSKSVSCADCFLHHACKCGGLRHERADAIWGCKGLGLALRCGGFRFQGPALFMISEHVYRSL